MELNFLCWLSVPLAHLPAACIRSRRTSLADSSDALSLCLEKLGVTDEKDRTALVIKVFWQCVPLRSSAAVRDAPLTAWATSHRYMQIARLLQTGYWLEPAGSHGAQGLDDYHFAVFSESAPGGSNLARGIVPLQSVRGRAACEPACRRS